MTPTAGQKAARENWPAWSAALAAAKAAGEPLPLTPRQREVFVAIGELFVASGCRRMPSYRELCDRLGISSPNGLYCHLAALERRGLIHAGRTPGKKVTTRGVEVVGLAAALRPAAEAFFTAHTATE
jgi:SOS-response transcriptional repressor LexA